MIRGAAGGAEEPSAATLAAMFAISTGGSFSDSESDSPTESEERYYSSLLPPGFLDPLSPEERSPPAAVGLVDGEHPSASAPPCFSLQRHASEPFNSERAGRPSGLDSRCSFGSPNPQPEPTEVTGAMASVVQVCEPPLSGEHDIPPGFSGFLPGTLPETSVNAPESKEEEPPILEQLLGQKEAPVALQKCPSPSYHCSSTLSSAEKGEEGRCQRKRRALSTGSYKDQEHSGSKREAACTRSKSPGRQEKRERKRKRRRRRRRDCCFSHPPDIVSTSSMYHERNGSREKRRAISTSSQPGTYKDQKHNDSKRKAKAASTGSKAQDRKRKRFVKSEGKRSNLSMEVCRKFTRGECRFPGCRFAHPPYTIPIQRGYVNVCEDFVRSWCPRRICLHYHPPPHIQASLLTKIGAPQHSTFVTDDVQQHGAFIFLPFPPQSINGWSNIQNQHISRSGEHGGLELLGAPGGTHGDEGIRMALHGRSSFFGHD